MAVSRYSPVALCRRLSTALLWAAYVLVTHCVACHSLLRTHARRAIDETRSRPFWSLEKPWVIGQPPSADRALPSKEFLENARALFGQHARANLRTMIQLGMPQQISNRAGHPGLFIPRAEDDPLHAR